MTGRSDSGDDALDRERDEATAHETRRADRRLTSRLRRMRDAWRGLAEGDR